MKNITQTITRYLTRPTEYAVLINGKWGQGKTWFFKHTLLDALAKIPTIKNDNKRYKPIYVSLFGLKSTEDIATKVVAEFYQSAIFTAYISKGKGNRALKISRGIFNIGLKGFMNVFSLWNPDDYKLDIQKIGANTLDPAELVICLDDLERRDDALTLKNLAGYINTLSEEGVKVILIANEDKLKEKNAFRHLKEKIVGVSVQFVPDVETTLNSIITNRYQKFPTFKKYLEEHKDLVLSFSKKIKNNFRNVIYALDMMHDCYAMLQKDILQPKSDIAGKLNETLPELTKFVLGIATEYKMSRLTANDIKTYTNQGKAIEKLLLLQTGDSQKLEETPLAKFQEKYSLQKEYYTCYTSLYTYITGQNELDAKAFMQEFARRFNLAKGKVLPEYEVLQTLYYDNYAELTDEAYKKNTVAVLKYGEEGKYKIIDYLSLIHLAERSNNMGLTNLDIDQTRQQLEKGIAKAIKNTPKNFSQEFTHFEFAGKGDKLNEHGKKLYEYGIKLIEEERKQRQIAEVRALADNFINDPSQFMESMQTDDSFRLGVDMNPFLVHGDIKKLLKQLPTFTNQQIILVKHFLQRRYKITEHLNYEFTKLKELNDGLVLLLKENEKDGKVRKSIVQDLSTVINNCLSQSSNLSHE